MYFSAASFIILLVVSPIAVIGDALSARSYIFRASNIANNQPLVNIGVIDFRQVGGSVLINGTIYGLAPGEHGFHVHDKGDIGNRCLASGAHFNPENKTHGAPTDSNRHVGDLGNVVADNSGIVRVDIEDTVVALHGPFSIIGRAVVVHEKRDDLGTGGTAASLSTGDAGNRLGCGVIGIFVN